MEKSEKMKKSGKFNQELFNEAREHSGAAVLIGKSLWRHTTNVVPYGSKMMRIKAKHDK